MANELRRRQLFRAMPTCWRYSNSRESQSCHHVIWFRDLGARSVGLNGRDEASRIQGIGRDCRVDRFLRWDLPACCIEVFPCLELV